MTETVRYIGGIKVVTVAVPVSDPKVLREVADRLRAKHCPPPTS